MSALIGKRHIDITAELVRALGANNAIVLQQVWWWSTESRKANDDDSITMTHAGLGKVTGLSQDAVYRSLKWLREQGYIEAEGDQQLTYWVTDKHNEIPLDTPAIPRRIRCDSAEVTSANSRRSALSTTSKGEKTLESTETSLSLVDGFERLWVAYPKRAGSKVGKAAARKQWDKLKPDEREAAMAGLQSYAIAKGAYPEDAERYLRHKRWVGIEVDTPQDRSQRMAEGALRFAEKMGMK
jgi:DNA-binding transcriptional ArsR family regulator